MTGTKNFSCPPKRPLHYCGPSEIKVRRKRKMGKVDSAARLSHEKAGEFVKGEVRD